MGFFGLREEIGFKGLDSWVLVVISGMLGIQLVGDIEAG